MKPFDWQEVTDHWYIYVGSTVIIVLLGVLMLHQFEKEAQVEQRYKDWIMENPCLARCLDVSSPMPTMEYLASLINETDKGVYN